MQQGETAQRHDYEKQDASGQILQLPACGITLPLSAID